MPTTLNGRDLDMLLQALQPLKSRRRLNLAGNLAPRLCKSMKTLGKRYRIISNLRSPSLAVR